MSSLKIGYFTDSHLREKVPGTSGSSRRMCRHMKARLEECVETFRAEKVDVVVGTGDIIDDAKQPQVPEDLAIIRNILDQLRVPKIIIPGNHDPYPGVFYEVFERSGFLTVMGRYQILSFIDFCAPGTEESERDRDSMVRMEKALSYKPEDIDMTVTLQHYEIYPEFTGGYPYNYTNATAIREAMEKSKTKVLSVSGHYHKGIPLTEHNGVTYFAGKALCEEPFPFYVIELSGKSVSMREIDCKA
jgi:predicted MPP superfamily phosphohydrolase